MGSLSCCIFQPKGLPARGPGPSEEAVRILGFMPVRFPWPVRMVRIDRAIHGFCHMLDLAYAVGFCGLNLSSGNIDSDGLPTATTPLTRSCHKGGSHAAQLHRNPEHCCQRRAIGSAGYRADERDGSPDPARC